MDKYEALAEKLNRVRTGILLNGPITVYGIERYLDLPNATAKRYFKTLLREKEIIQYRTEPHKSGNIKILYGPTLYGYLRWFRIPKSIAKKNFGAAMKIWLPEDKFEFFLPKNELQEALKNSQVVVHLSRFCQMIADVLPDAEDFSSYLEDQGYSESNPSQIISLAMQFVGRSHAKEWTASSKVLVKYLPTYQQQLQQFIRNQRERLDRMEKEIFGHEGGSQE